MDPPESFPSRVIPAAALIHQEGALGVIALVGLYLRQPGIIGGLAPRGPVVTAVLLGIGIGLASSLILWLIRGLAPLASLERWQREMVRGWTVTDAVTVAVFSGLAEEALIRALLQPLIGLVPAAAIFAVLHLVPDRRLWLWPILALVLGLVLGVAFELAGYPAAAAAHLIINGFALVRLRTLPAD